MKKMYSKVASLRQRERNLNEILAASILIYCGVSLKSLFLLSLILCSVCVVPNAKQIFISKIKASLKLTQA